MAKAAKKATAMVAYCIVLAVLYINECEMLCRGPGAINVPVEPLKILKLGVEEFSRSQNTSEFPGIDERQKLSRFCKDCFLVTNDWELRK